MTMDLGTPEKGCLLLADITGYTEYMGETELMHAQDVVADLLETIVDSVEPMFQLSKLEGDAAFAYADHDSVNPSMMMDTIESAYFAFQRRPRDIAHSTSCECNACVRIPKLDLKFFVHDGEYVVRTIARSEELTGRDVILVHRLAKGTSGAEIGKPAYAVYTKVTLDAMAMDPAILGFKAHTEVFPDIGEVDVRAGSGCSLDFRAGTKSGLRHKRSVRLRNELRDSCPTRSRVGLSHGPEEEAALARPGR